MRRLGSDGIAALALLILCAELYRETFWFRSVPFATMSPSVWPRFVIVVLALLCVALLVQSLRAPAPAAAGAAAVRPAKPMSHRTALVCFGLFAAFLAVTPWLGMLVAGVLYVFVMQEVLGPRDVKSRVVHLAIALVSVGGMWAVFTFALNVILPVGRLLRI